MDNFELERSTLNKLGLDAVLICHQPIVYRGNPGIYSFILGATAFYSSASALLAAYKESCVYEEGTSLELYVKDFLEDHYTLINGNWVE